LSLGKEIRDALLWGTANAASVMMHVGPHKGLLTKKELEDKISLIKEGDMPQVLN